MILFIVNERAGNGRGKRAWAAVERHMRVIGRSSDYVKVAAHSEAEALGEAEALAAQGGITALIAVGGDGTLHALLPLAARCRLPLGLIPCGSGNDTARAFRLPRQPLAALNVALSGQTRRVDVLRSAAIPSDDASANAPHAVPGVHDDRRSRQAPQPAEWSLTRVAAGLDSPVADDRSSRQAPYSPEWPLTRFAAGPDSREVADDRPSRQASQPSELTLTCIAAGLDGAVAADVNGSRYKRWCNRLGVGSAAYVIGLFRALARFRPQTAIVTVDGTDREFRRCWLAAVANTPAYGGGMRICPSASPSDGRLQLCVVHGCSAWQLLLIFPTVLFGKHVRSRFVTMLSGQRAAIRSPRPMPAFGDGEPIGSVPLEAEIVPGQLLILTSCSG